MLRLACLATAAFLSASAPSFAQTSEGDGSAPALQIYFLVGQSNMEGRANLSVIEHQLEDPERSKRFAHLVDDDGWVRRKDVFIDFFGRTGPLSIGYAPEDKIGPEVDFGHAVGDHHDAPVLLIKVAWGGRSLFRDFRSPSAGMPNPTVIGDLLERRRKDDPSATPAEIKGSFGASYREMLKEVRRSLGEIDTVFPTLAGRDHHYGGFVWFQGWNDVIDSVAIEEYEENMVHFIKDVRRDLEMPKLPFVVGQLGVGGIGRPNEKRDAFKAAQAAATVRPEFEGNVALVLTDQYWDEDAQTVFDKGWREHQEEWSKVGSDRPYHYLGSPRTVCDIGRALAKAVLELRPASATADGPEKDPATVAPKKPAKGPAR